MALVQRVELGSAYAVTNENGIEVYTGAVKREWRRTGAGLVTTRLIGSSEENWCSASGIDCDWGVPGLIGGGSTALLRSCHVSQSDDDGFTADHILVTTEFEYPASDAILRHEIRVYPGAPGIWTRISIRGTKNGGTDESFTEHLSVQLNKAIWRQIGYFAGTQNRNAPDTPLLRQETGPFVGRQVCDWSSVACIERSGHGLALVKESHKCVNSPGIDSGAFVLEKDSIRVTGMGLQPSEWLPDRYRHCWATWSILYSGAELELQTALKTFDQIRYPIDPGRDVYVLANTWGSSDDTSTAQQAASEANILRELASQAELGIDVQQVDDGWQGNAYNNWWPAKERYPAGWTNIRQRADELGVHLGLWAAGSRIPLEDLVASFKEGGFRQYKLDFVSLEEHEHLERLVGKVRTFIKWSGHRIRANWDLTEAQARFGYWFGREYGSIYLANRKPKRPEHVVYIPWLMLRDLWELAHYVNLNRFQGTIQNVDRVDKEKSDACFHSHPYSVAIALMSTPVFFQETQLYCDQAREEIRQLLRLYKEQRDGMYRGIIYPIGDVPSNASWTGFQCHRKSANEGWLLVFRERLSAEREAQVQLHFLEGREICLRDLGTCEIKKIPDASAISMDISQPGDFRFMHYKVV